MKYRKISPCIWNDAKVRELSDKGKLALLFLLTHPHMTPLGAIRANAPGLACELGWSEKVFRKAFGEVLALGIAKEDAKAPLVWFPNFLRHNMPESPNVVRSWVGAFRDLPESPLKGAMLERTGEAVLTLGEGFRSAFAEAFPGVLGGAAPGVSASRPGNLAGAPSEALPIPFGEAFAEGMPNQEQEQEQRRKGGRGTRAGGAIRDGGLWRGRGLSRLAGAGLRAGPSLAPEAFRRTEARRMGPLRTGACRGNIHRENAHRGEALRRGCPCPADGFLAGRGGRRVRLRIRPSIRSRIRPRTRRDIRQGSGRGIRRPSGRSGLSPRRAPSRAGPFWKGIRSGRGSCPAGRRIPCSRGGRTHGASGCGFGSAGRFPNPAPCGRPSGSCWPRTRAGGGARSPRWRNGWPGWAGMTARS